MKSFPYASLCKTSDPWGRAIFDPMAITNNLRGPQDKAIQQISKAKAF